MTDTKLEVLSLTSASFIVSLTYTLGSVLGLLYAVVIGSGMSDLVRVLHIGGKIPILTSASFILVCYLTTLTLRTIDAADIPVVVHPSVYIFSVMPLFFYVIAMMLKSELMAFTMIFGMFGLYEISYVMTMIYEIFLWFRKSRNNSKSES